MGKKYSWWGDPKNAKKWIEQVEKHNSDRHYTEQPNIVLDALKDHINKFDSILEVGSGTGHLIGNIKKKYPEKFCRAVDINPELLKYVDIKYPEIDDFFLGDITNINSGLQHEKSDLVFCYQMLQHITPEKFVTALTNLMMMAKKEVWMWEGIGKLDYKHGDQTSKAHDGSWVYHIDKIVDCYEVSIPKTGKLELPRQRLYKIKL